MASAPAAPVAPVSPFRTAGWGHTDVSRNRRHAKLVPICGLVPQVIRVLVHLTTSKGGPGPSTQTTDILTHKVLGISCTGRRFLSSIAWMIARHRKKLTIETFGKLCLGSPEANARYAAGFRKGLNETGYIDGQNVVVEYHWLEEQYDRLPALVADLVRRQVTLIVTPGNVPTNAARAATTTIPIVFGVGEDPVRLGLVASLAHPGGNVTGINFQTSEVVAKRLRLLHDMLPKAARIAVLINPGNPTIAQSTVRDAQEAAPIIGMQIQTFNASTIGEIDEAFTAFGREHPDALFVARHS